MTDTCIFCGILAGRVEASVVAADEHAVAFMDRKPINAGHVLIVPRRHAAQLTDLSEDEAASAFRLVHRVAVALPKSGIRCEGYRLSQANGAAAGQEVFHVHFHLVPRFQGDSVRLVVDPDRPKYSREELNRFAASIAGAVLNLSRDGSTGRSALPAPGKGRGAVPASVAGGRTRNGRQTLSRVRVERD